MAPKARRRTGQKTPIPGARKNPRTGQFKTLSPQVRKALQASGTLIKHADPNNPFGLKPKELLFVAAYCGEADFNASKAYEMAGYKPNTSDASALRRSSTVSLAINAKMAERAGTLEISSGREALARISAIARADLRQAFPKGHAMRELPDSVGLAVKAITPTKWGYRIELSDPLRANELLAKAGGVLKEQVEVQDLTWAQLLGMSFEDPPAPTGAESAGPSSELPPGRGSQRVIDVRAVETEPAGLPPARDESAETGLKMPHAHRRETTGDVVDPADAPDRGSTGILDGRAEPDQG